MVLLLVLEIRRTEISIPCICVIGIKQSNAGKGYGKSLLRQLKRGPQTSFYANGAYGDVPNERAYNLYLSHGFEVEGVKRKSLKVDRSVR